MTAMTEGRKQGPHRESHRLGIKRGHKLRSIQILKARLARAEQDLIEIDAELVRVRAIEDKVRKAAG